MAVTAAPPQELPMGDVETLVVSCNKDLGTHGFRIIWYLLKDEMTLNPKTLNPKPLNP